MKVHNRKMSTVYNNVHDATNNSFLYANNWFEQQFTIRTKAIQLALFL